MSSHVDVALIGGGIMSATLGTLLSRLQPEWSIAVFERRSELAEESSNPWNNAGTGHAAYCELNYTPEQSDGSLTITNALKVNEQFLVSRQLWSTLVDEGVLPEPRQFINPVPHLTFVWGEANVAYLRKRYDALQGEPLFASMEYTEDPATIHSWAPLLMPGRAKDEPVAATRVLDGTDVDFGAQTKDLFAALERHGADIRTNTRVTGLKQLKDGRWRISTRNEHGSTPGEITANFVFVGAGGAALSLLQRSGIREIRGYGGFPISGQFLRTDDPEIVAQHWAKVYGKAAVGAPPMSVPHLDTRVVDGTPSLMFGPYAGFSTRFLKHGSLFDLFGSLRWHNIGTMLGAGLKNLGLVKYLIGEVFASRHARIEALRQFAPSLDGEGWRKIIAGQRVQIMKRGADGKAVLAFGTEVVAGRNGTIAGLLGASPGASTAVPIMLELLDRCFPERIDGWRPQLTEWIPSYGTTLATDGAAVDSTLESTRAALDLESLPASDDAAVSA